MDCLLKRSAYRGTFITDVFCKHIRVLLEFTVSFMHTQKHSAAQKSRLPGIPLLALPSLEGRERALPRSLPLTLHVHLFLFPQRGDQDAGK